MAISPVIYAEVSNGFVRIESCESALRHLHIEREPLPWAAAFLAGKVYAEYRRRWRAPLTAAGSLHRGSAVRGMRLLTRDAGRYRSYFPRLQLVSPG